MRNINTNQARQGPKTRWHKQKKQEIKKQGTQNDNSGIC